MYDSAPDPYCYKSTRVLKNLARLRSQHRLDQFEHEAALVRSGEPLPDGALDAAHYRAIHHHLFQDVYAWAGQYRTVRISKGGNMFCYPENIPHEMDRLFVSLRRGNFLRELAAEVFAAQSAHFLAELNAIHPFREGNGRTQLTFLALPADQAGRPLDFERLRPDVFLAALIESFTGKEAPLADAIGALTPARASRGSG